MRQVFDQKEAEIKKVLFKHVDDVTTITGEGTHYNAHEVSIASRVTNNVRYTGRDDQKKNWSMHFLGALYMTKLLNLSHLGNDSIKDIDKGGLENEIALCMTAVYSGTGELDHDLFLSHYLTLKCGETNDVKV